jgi:septal ring factor EnvC (AmiA/AmiB activator)
MVTPKQTIENPLYGMFSDEEEKGPPTAQKYLAGLKLSSSHIMKVMTMDNNIAEVPSARYVKLLEDQIKDLRQQIRQQEQSIKRLTRAINRSIADQDSIRDELSRKIDMGE